VIASAIEEDSPLSARTLAEVGIPPYDIVRVDGETESAFFLLSADREARDRGWDRGLSKGDRP
jgi:adenylyltransferase/sulfurtransferase